MCVHAPPQALLLLLDTVCVVWMGLKLGCRVNISPLRFATLQEENNIGDSKAFPEQISKEHTSTVNMESVIRG